MASARSTCLAREEPCGQQGFYPSFFRVSGVGGARNRSSPPWVLCLRLPGLGSAPPPLQALFAHVSGVFAT